MYNLVEKDILNWRKVLLGTIEYFLSLEEEDLIVVALLFRLQSPCRDDL